MKGAIASAVARTSLRVYSGQTNGQRVIAACRSASAFIKLAGVPRWEATGETSNLLERAIAMAQPGIVFTRPVEDTMAEFVSLPPRERYAFGRKPA